jgi:hypothetical protein
MGAFCHGITAPLKIRCWHFFPRPPSKLRVGPFCEPQFPITFEVVNHSPRPKRPTILTFLYFFNHIHFEFDPPVIVVILPQNVMKINTIKNVMFSHME